MSIARMLAAFIMSGYLSHVLNSVGTREQFPAKYFLLLLCHGNDFSFFCNFLQLYWDGLAELQSMLYTNYY